MSRLQNALYIIDEISINGTLISEQHTAQLVSLAHINLEHGSYIHMSVEQAMTRGGR